MKEINEKSNSANTTENVKHMKKEVNCKCIKEDFSEISTKALPPGFGYAKITGDKFSYLIQSTTVDLGRGNVSNALTQFIGIGEDKKISRKHAKICWNQSQGTFQIQNTGKNPILVQRKFVNPLEVVNISSKTPIKIGPACFYFLLPLKSI